jgi:ribosomal RNA assembly protein
MEMIDFIRIPEERLKILKKDKKFKEKLEKFSESKIKFNEDISIECEDPLILMRIKLVLQAFGRGFDFESAMNLLDEEYRLETIEIKDYAGKSRGRMTTLKGRVIGTKGKTKKLIENCTETKIAIYGKTICIIGKWDRIMIAKKAVEMLLNGRLHTTVYRFLEKIKR